MNFKLHQLSWICTLSIFSTALATQAIAAPPTRNVQQRRVRPAPPRQPVAPPPVSREERVDLNSMSAPPPPPPAPAAAQGSQDSGNSQAAAPTQASSATAAAHHNILSAAPNFKVYFDLNLVMQPGLRDFTFDNYHSFLFFEIQPTPELQFSFDVNPAPRYYELDYQILPRLQLRAGRIWIPWDDLSPHNIYGGRVNVSRLQAPGVAAFLPDLWTDLGLGLKYTIADSMDLNVTADLYVVNGFHDGGADPSPISANEPTGYPNFQDTGSTYDNNKDKAVGARLHGLLFNRLGLGASFYTGRWNNDTEDDEHRVMMVGFDGQLKLGPKTEFRLGVATFLVDIPTANYNRGGLYAEIGQKLGSENKVKVLSRFGVVQLDSRVIDVTDQTIGGLMILWQPGLIQYSIETSYDFNAITGKLNRSYSAARLVVAF